MIGRYIIIPQYSEHDELVRIMIHDTEQEFQVLFKPNEEWFRNKVDGEWTEWKKSEIEPPFRCKNTTLEDIKNNIREKWHVTKGVRAETDGKQKEEIRMIKEDMI